MVPVFVFRAIFSEARPLLLLFQAFWLPLSCRSSCHRSCLRAMSFIFVSKLMRRTQSFLLRYMARTAVVCRRCICATDTM